jgi:hypothetical protein
LLRQNRAFFVGGVLKKIFECNVKVKAIFCA